MSIITLSPESTAQEAAEVLDGRIAENLAPVAIVPGDTQPLAKRLQDEGYNVSVLDSEELTGHDPDLIRRSRRDQRVILVRRPSDAEIAQRIGLDRPATLRPEQ